VPIRPKKNVGLQPLQILAQRILFTCRVSMGGRLHGYTAIGNDYEWMDIMTDLVVLRDDGSVNLPQPILDHFGLKPGDRLSVFAMDGTITLISQAMALKSIRDDIIKSRGSLDGILDEFLAEKHEEARREWEEGR
jgi:bifunctional DNA-binding transcriptional regulator/antitoxin component of YhaV-PrlF toxin-antitoxin module